MILIVNRYIPSRSDHSMLGISPLDRPSIVYYNRSKDDDGDR